MVPPGQGYYPWEGWAIGKCILQGFVYINDFIRKWTHIRYLLVKILKQRVLIYCPMWKFLSFSSFMNENFLKSAIQHHSTGPLSCSITKEITCRPVSVGTYLPRLISCIRPDSIGLALSGMIPWVWVLELFWISGQPHRLDREWESALKERNGFWLGHLIQIALQAGDFFHGKPSNSWGSVLYGNPRQGSWPWLRAVLSHQLVNRWRC